MSIHTAMASPRFSMSSSLGHFSKCRMGWLAILCAGLMAGCGSTPIDVSVETKDNPVSDGQLTYVVVTAKEDKVQIKAVTANRGNCKVLSYTGSPYLKFGDQLRTLMFCNGSPIQEAEVETDTGKFSYTF